MSDAQMTKDPVSLEDLKRAISYATTDVDDFDSDAARERARGDAWRTAFEWLDQISLKTTHAGCIRRNTGSAALLIEATLEGNEGMRLIREKLS